MKFKYVGLQGDKEVEGLVVASSKDEAIAELNRRGIAVLKCSRVFDLNIVVIGDERLAELLEDLALLVRSGVTLIQAVRIVASSSKEAKYLFEDVLKLLEEGREPAEAFRVISNYLGDLAIEVMAVQFATGNMEGAFEFAAQIVKMRAQVKSSLFKNVSYPLFLYYVALSLVYFLSKFAIPRLKSVVIRIAASKIPKIALVSFKIFDVLRVNTWIFLLAALLPLLLIAALLSRKLAAFLTRILNKLPLVGRIIDYYVLYQLSATFYISLKSGVLVTNVLSNAERMSVGVWRDRIKKVRELVMEGKSLSDAFKEVGFPFEFTNFVEIGERSGNLDESFLAMKMYYERRFNQMLAFMLKFVETAFILGIAFMIGFIALMVVTPMMAMYSGVGK